MTPVLTLNAYGIPSIDLSLRSGTKQPPVFIGDVSNAFAGNERNSVRSSKRVWNATTVPLDMDTEASVQSVIYNAAQILCAGTLIVGNATDGSTVLCSVRCTSSVMDSTARWVMQLVISEVAPF